jgi:hypothetical protein
VVEAEGAIPRDPAGAVRRRGAWTGDCGPIGLGLCTILHPTFREFLYHDV